MAEQVCRVGWAACGAVFRAGAWAAMATPPRPTSPRVVTATRATAVLRGKRYLRSRAVCGGPPNSGRLRPATGDSQNRRIDNCQVPQGAFDAASVAER